jgi:hypothetical protein
MYIFVNGEGLLKNDNILYSGRQMENDKYVPNEDLEDKGTFLVVPAGALAIEERHLVEDDVVSTNPAFPSTNSATLN